MSNSLAERPSFTELMQDLDFREEQNFLMQEIANALDRARGHPWDQLEALAQYIAFVMIGAEEEGLSKLAVLERVFAVISHYHHDIAFTGTSRPK
jgi:hypothetical protein